jgi:hypothetical protein
VKVLTPFLTHFKKVSKEDRMTTDQTWENLPMEGEDGTIDGGQRRLN